MLISRSGYYAWLKRDKSLRERENERLVPLVKAAHKKSKGTYGARRIAVEVEAHGSSCGRTRAGTLMKLAGVAAKQKKKFKATTDSKHNLPIAPNLLNRQFEVQEPDKVYVSDITYIWTREEARRDIIDYIEMFYNSNRRHSYLGYLSPKEFEESWLNEP